MASSYCRGTRPVRPGASSPAVTVVLAAVLLTTGCGGPTSSPDQGVPPRSPAQTPATRSPDAPTATPSPRLVTPVAGAQERRAAWRLVRSGPGPALVVEVQAGGPPCDVVTDLDVRETERTVRLTVWAGRETGASCPDVPAVVGTVHLRVPLAAPLGSRSLHR